MYPNNGDPFNPKNEVPNYPPNQKKLYKNAKSARPKIRIGHNNPRPPCSKKLSHLFNQLHQNNNVENSATTSPQHSFHS